MSKPTLIPVTTWTDADKLKEWLVEQATGDMTTLLAHADDGVIWGKVEGGTLKLAGDVFNQVNVKLRCATLQQARLFGPGGELFLWRTDTGWQARLIGDSDPLPEEDDTAFEENHILWGTHATYLDGFTLLEEGNQELFHAPPGDYQDILQIGSAETRVRLRVRHYIDYDEVGQAYIYLSRLVTLEPRELPKELNDDLIP